VGNDIVKGLILNYYRDVDIDFEQSGTTIKKRGGRKRSILVGFS